MDKLGDILNEFYRNDEYTTKMAQRDIINFFVQENEAKMKEELGKFFDFTEVMGKVYDLKDKDLVINKYLKQRNNGTIS
jgi:hypothetical protein